MMKKNYLKPATRMVNINVRHQLLTGSIASQGNISSVSNNVQLHTTGQSSFGTARSRSFSHWEDDEW